MNTKTEHPPNRTDAHWQRWGDEDPYYGVITDQRFRRDRLTPEALKQFFRSGQHHVKHLLTVCRKHVDPSFKPQRVLDFGCGVGRLLVAFARYAPEVVGVDVSDGMLTEARRNCDDHGLPEVVLARSDDGLSEVGGSFDLIHSSIVFQHIEPPRGLELIARLIERLRPGGIAALHLTYAKAYFPASFGQPPPVPAAAEVPVVAPPARPEPLRRGRWRLPFAPAPRATEPEVHTAPSDEPSTIEAIGGDPEMQMNPYPLNSVFFLIQQAGARDCHVEFTDHGGELGVTLYFRRPAV